MESDTDKSGDEQQYDYKNNKMEDGDYIIQAHIIEGRELKGLDMNNMSDPMVKVSIFDQEKSTSIGKQRKNVKRDQILSFEFLIFLN